MLRILILSKKLAVVIGLGQILFYLSFVRCAKTFIPSCSLCLLILKVEMHFRRQHRFGHCVLIIIIDLRLDTFPEFQELSVGPLAWRCLCFFPVLKPILILSFVLVIHIFISPVSWRQFLIFNRKTMAIFECIFEFKVFNFFSLFQPLYYPFTIPYE